MAANGRPGAARHCQGTPIDRHNRLGSPNDLYHVTIGQGGAKRAQFAIDLHAQGGVAHIRMDPIGKVERHGPAWQADQPALGRKDEDLIEEHFQLGMFD